MPTTDALLSDLSKGMAALSTEMRVYVRAGRFTEVAPDMSELTTQIHELLTQIFADVVWKRSFAPFEPMTAQAIEHCLEPVEVRDLPAFMASVAPADIIWPSHRLTDPSEAIHAATRVVTLLGRDATWWTNHDTDCGATNLITPVFDSLIAGTNGEYFAMLIQVADD